MRTCGVDRWAFRSVAFLSFVVLLLLLSVPAALALEPPRPGELARLQRQGKLEQALRNAKALGNYKLSPALLRRAVQTTQRAQLGLMAPFPTPPSAWRGMPTTGNVKVLALLIDFSDYPAKNPSSAIQSKLFGSGVAGDYPYESLTNFYKRSSYDQLTIGGDVLGWYRAGPRSAVSQTVAGRETLIKRALAYYDSQGQDFSQYDNNGDGEIDYFIVVWSGPDTGWSNFWWAYQTSYQDQSVVLDGKNLRTYSWLWECRYATDGTTTGNFDQIVTMHETGHALGLPDYYDYDTTVGPNGGVGGLDMMDSDWGDHNAFSKWVLGWITPQVVTGAPKSVTLAASGTSADALVVMSGASSSNPFSEYFVVQNRQRLGNDSGCVNIPLQNLPGDGLLAWHVDARLNATGDDYLYNNSYTSHKLLRLMEADGLGHIETTSGTTTWPRGYAEAGDYYKSGKTLTDTSNPNSKKYDGSASKVAVTGIGSPGASMTVQAGVSGIVPPGDKTAPVTTASGVDDRWHRSDVVVVFAVSDTESGPDLLRYSVDDGSTWYEMSLATYDSLRFKAKSDHSNDGVWRLSYYAVDKAGNKEATHTVTLKIDTRGPTCSAKRATVVRGRVCKLWFNVKDSLSPQVKETVRIKTRSGVTKKTFTWTKYDDVLPAGYWWTVKWRCKLRKGTYFIVVTGKDLAGNNASVIGKAKLMVR